MRLSYLDPPSFSGLLLSFPGQSALSSTPVCQSPLSPSHLSYQGQSSAQLYQHPNSKLPQFYRLISLNSARKRPPFQPGPLLYSYRASTKFAATPEPIQANELVAPISSQRSHYLTIEILCGAAQVLLAQNPTS